MGTQNVLDFGDFLSVSGNQPNYGNTKIGSNIKAGLLAPVALLPIKYHFFPPGGSLIQYVTENRIALTLGDPIGPLNDLDRCVHEFMTFYNFKGLHAFKEKFHPEW